MEAAPPERVTDTLHCEALRQSVLHHAAVTRLVDSGAAPDSGLPLLNHHRLCREHDARNTARVCQPAASDLRVPPQPIRKPERN